MFHDQVVGSPQWVLPTDEDRPSRRRRRRRSEVALGRRGRGKIEGQFISEDVIEGYGRSSGMAPEAVVVEFEAAWSTAGHLLGPRQDGPDGG